MSALDLVVLCCTLGFIVIYGVYKTRGAKDIKGYLLGGNTMKWGTIGLSVMATQASAITFISTPGQAYESGMGFVQNYFGMPLALIVVAVVFIPIFYKLKVYTAYEFLERRFDVNTRYLGAALFLVQRGLSAGITIYAPAIIISSLLGWDLVTTILGTGILVIIYTTSGGTRAVSITQKQQMAVIMGGMFTAFFILIYFITRHTPLSSALELAGSLGKLEAVNFSTDAGERYTIWSGILGGFFLQLSYFGTDQSQVQRYLGGASASESKLGLMFNAMLKIPMQFFILFTGVLVYVFYIYYGAPIHFKAASVDEVQASAYSEEYESLVAAYDQEVANRRSLAIDYAEEVDAQQKAALKSQFKNADASIGSMREQAKQLIRKVDDALVTKDADYVFLTFIITYLPHGLIGLLIAVIFSAAMSSTASELNALASTTSVDFYKRAFHTSGTDMHYLVASKVFTLGWGVLAILFALLANQSENLIEAVNIVGSLFYGTVLGIFLVAFFMKKVTGKIVFVAAILSQMAVICIHFMTLAGLLSLSYLWYNLIGCLGTLLLSALGGLLSKKV